MLRAYKYCLLPNDIQKQQLANFFGSARFIYNLGLETKIAAWVSAKVNVSCFDLMKQLTELKNSGEADWLKESPAQMLQASLRNLDNAYTKFFKGAGFPRFKSRRGRQSIQFPQGVYIDGGKIFIPKLKLVSFIKHRPIGEGAIKTVTLSKESTGKYFVSVLVDNGLSLPDKKSIIERTAVGIDVGLKTFATLSDGQTFDNPKYLQEQLSRLRIEQRKLARRFKRGVKEQSKSYQKQKLIVARLHEKIRNKRQDFLHKTSATIVKEYDTVCMENLNILGMVQNSKLAKSITDSGWREFMDMLSYKAEWNGKNIIQIGRFDPSSKICSNCGHIFKELTLLIREWDCDKCGTYHNRDENAAKNIKSFGLKTKISTKRGD